MDGQLTGGALVRYSTRCSQVYHLSIVVIAKSYSRRFPRYLSEDSQGILSGLLTRDPSLRLGSGPTDAEEIKAHDFFHCIEWGQLAAGRLAPPWEPVVTGSLDTVSINSNAR